MKKYFKSNFPKKRRMGKCITTKLNFFFDFSSLLIAYIRASRLGRFSSEIVGDRDDCAVGAPEVNTPASLCAEENQPLSLFCRSPDSRPKTHPLPAQEQKNKTKATLVVCVEMQGAFHLYRANNGFSKKLLFVITNLQFFFCIFAKFKIKSALLNVNLFTFITVY